MKFQFLFLGFLPVWILIFSCQNDENVRNIEAFYFPLKDLKEGKVYEYRSVGNEHDPPIYWYYKSLRENGTAYLLGTSYDPEFSPDQFAREERVHNGMVLVDFYTYEKDSTGAKQQVRAEIAAANVFPFEVKKKPGVLLTSMRWESLAGNATYELVRNRQYDSDTTFVYKNKTLPAVQFNVRELIDQEVEGHLELEYAATEIYAKGLGLVYFSKDIDNWQMKYQLEDIYSMEEFEKKFKAKLEE